MVFHKGKVHVSSKKLIEKTRQAKNKGAVAAACPQNVTLSEQSKHSNDFGLTRAANLLGDYLYHGDDLFKLVDGRFKKISADQGTK